MTKLLEKAIETVRDLPDAQQDEIARAIFSLVGDEIFADGGQPVSERQLEMLKQRLADDDDDHTEGETWEQFRLRVEPK